MEGVAGNDSTDITFKIFDTDSPNGENLLYDSAGNSAPDDLWTDLWPGVAGVLTEVKRRNE